MLEPVALGEPEPVVLGELEPDGDAPLLDDAGGLTPRPPEDMPDAGSMLPEAPDGLVVPVAPVVIAPGREALHAAANSGRATTHARFLRDPCTKFIASETHT